ncbi:carbohydrate kinase family protein, partial [Candidatus Saccharibacteria bacterium]|nr:carbohydrate kinase family protein [Candidatus Saccharibacteria bacterium]
LKNYSEITIITDGPMGGIATDGNETFRFGLYEDMKPKDATGAGDAFGSGFLAHFADGKSFRESLIFASANSTSVISKVGANAGILTGAEKLHPMLIQKI